MQMHLIMTVLMKNSASRLSVFMHPSTVLSFAMSIVSGSADLRWSSMDLSFGMIEEELWRMANKMNGVNVKPWCILLHTLVFVCIRLKLRPSFPPVLHRYLLANEFIRMFLPSITEGTSLFPSIHTMAIGRALSFAKGLSSIHSATILYFPIDEAARASLRHSQDYCRLVLPAFCSILSVNFPLQTVQIMSLARSRCWQGACPDITLPKFMNFMGIRHCNF